MKNNILYKFVKIDLNEFSPSWEKFKSGTVSVRANFDFKFGAEQRILTCINVFKIVIDEEDILSVKLSTYYEIEESSINEMRENKTLTIPKMFLAQLASLNIGTLRGIIYLKLINTPLENFILPPIEVRDIFKEDLEIRIS